MKEQPTFFDFAAEVGLTKHIGGIIATDELLEQCQLDPDKCILDVGCGVGATPVYIAKTRDCKIVGVDISPKMIERSEEWAKRERVADRVTFRVADARDLPFDDDAFDAVITESVVALVEDKEKALREFARVTKPGGYVGLNETVWLKVPVPPEVITWASQDVGATVNPLTRDAWKELLEGAGLAELVVRTYNINIQAEAKWILQRYGLGGMLRVLWRTLRLYTRSKAYREFVAGVRQGGITPENLDEYFGYGLFVGRKESSMVEIETAVRAEEDMHLWQAK